MSSTEKSKCLRGHESPRRKNGNCIQCETERYKNDGKKKTRMAEKSRKKWASLKADPDAMAAHRDYMKAYAAANREKLNEGNRRLYSENRIRIQLRRKGIEPTESMIEAIENHHGACDICGGEADGRWGVLSIDHDHQTGKARGMLCTKCNKGLGQFRDDPALLRAAIAYLKTPPLQIH